MTKGQVHRFGDTVAAYIGTGATVYMTARQARIMARALNRAARSVERESFVNSSGNTCALAFDDWPANNEPCPRLERDAEGRAMRKRRP